MTTASMMYAIHAATAPAPFVSLRACLAAMHRVSARSRADAALRAAARSSQYGYGLSRRDGYDAIDPVRGEPD
jgi:hypothetical protein